MGTKRLSSASVGRLRKFYRYREKILDRVDNILKDLTKTEALLLTSISQAENLDPSKCWDICPEFLDTFGVILAVEIPAWAIPDDNDDEASETSVDEALDDPWYAGTA